MRSPIGQQQRIGDQVHWLAEREIYQLGGGWIN
jgi:hypothetical protein